MDRMGGITGKRGCVTPPAAEAIRPPAVRPHLAQHLIHGASHRIARVAWLEGSGDPGFRSVEPKLRAGPVRRGQVSSQYEPTQRRERIKNFAEGRVSARAGESVRERVGEANAGS
ncbi:hypothetical protein G7Z17_g6499 [Cylindrodendrum hubeiense]|uniref:Uncharacterized protein n=1 Tax=Cylindrodendrum hubeiense TaxID=595255 RepID=A0A9P5HA33_9HYPO|nr:hypothetical protein G7Z17_g6499 [Cylindrodendrum hubeiense]